MLTIKDFKTVESKPIFKDPIKFLTTVVGNPKMHGYQPTFLEYFNDKYVFRIDTLENQWVCEILEKPDFYTTEKSNFLNSFNSKRIGFIICDTKKKFLFEINKWIEAN